MCVLEEREASVEMGGGTTVRYETQMAPSKITIMMYFSLFFMHSNSSFYVTSV